MTTPWTTCGSDTRTAPTASSLSVSMRLLGRRMISKDRLKERQRGRGGTVVRLRTPHPVWGDTVVVKDLMNGRGYDRPDRVGVGPADRGVAFGVALTEIEAILEP